ncbi:hypothetical protein BDF19DRAFT_410198 [Syncephalis fuscata]|nr:hypothetical protein BDF19DRAFT_410198 [Syncephalis fuscata]
MAKLALPSVISISQLLSSVVVNVDYPRASTITKSLAIKQLPQMTMYLVDTTGIILVTIKHTNDAPTIMATIGDKVEVTCLQLQPSDSRYGPSNVKNHFEVAITYEQLRHLSDTDECHLLII